MSTKSIVGNLPGGIPNLGDTAQSTGVDTSGGAAATEVKPPKLAWIDAPLPDDGKNYLFPSNPPVRFWDQDRDGVVGEQLFAGLGHGDLPDFRWPGATKLVVLEPCRGLDNLTEAGLSWWGRMEEVAQAYLLQTQIVGMANFADNLGKPSNLGMLTGVDKATVRRSDFAPDDKTVGFAGAPSGGALRRVDVELSGRVGSLAAAFWTETKDGQVVNGGWIGKVPEELAWAGLAQAGPSYFGARFDVKD